MTRTEELRSHHAVTAGRGGSWIADPATAFSAEQLRSRLLGSLSSWRDYPPSLRLWFWLLPVITTAIGGVLRFWRLEHPHSLVFDETYYVKDAYSYLQSGYERNWPEKANDAFNAGNPTVILGTPEYVVHPPVGKWMIAWGMNLFGPESSFGWRFSAALTGTVSILLVALIAQKLFKSLALGTTAGLLTAIDGTHLVLSRTSLLDIFLMFWILASFGALLLDRDDGRRRLAARLGQRATARHGNANNGAFGGRPLESVLFSGPWLGIRPWRLVAAVCMGLAVGTKWSALFFMAAFGILMVLWDMGARRSAGIRGWLSAGVIKDGIPAFLQYVPVAGGVYLATWTGWFLSKDAYFRQWALSNPSEQWGWIPNSLRSLAHYHIEAYNFHQGLSADHPYKASAWTWLVMGRPTSFYYQSPKLGQSGCEVQSCSEAILPVGNPLIWWGAIIALVVLLFWWIGRRDWRAGAIMAGVGAGYLPWFMYPERTTFFFYAIAFEPFLVLAVCFVLGLLLGKRTDPVWRRRSGVLVVGILVAAALLLSAYFYPIWTGETISYNDWHLRMWMPSWI
ncbi:dolichyl-phosphate-mannose--protein mannosyltransferase [Pseudarthrobacter sp. J1738]|uniref:dolichyl-phosphate-mannose--protein mannosyltransferase n=1 Tax=Pseudarthrobacter sp. J1738 TaxID=3420446 RepID=UPI003D2DBB71